MFEVSAKEALNVDDAFNTVARQALAQIKEDEVFPTNIDLRKPKGETKKGGCC